MDDNKKKFINISEGLILIGLTAFSYLVYYLYYSEFYSYFNLPIVFLEFNIIKAIKPIVLFLTPNLVVFFFIYRALYFNIYKSLNSFGQMKRLFWIYFSLVSILFFNLLFISKNIGIMAVAYLIITFLIFIYLLIMKILAKAVSKFIIWYIKKTGREENFMASIEKNELTFDTKQKLMDTYFFIFSYFFILLFFASLLGYSSAKNQENFAVVIGESGNQIILDGSKDDLIVSTYNVEKKELDYKFYVITTEELSRSGSFIVNGKIGPFPDYHINRQNILLRYLYKAL